MAKPIIEVNNISKRYTLGAIGATRLMDDVERLWHRISGKVARPDKMEFRALDDVSFTVETGDILGIVGRNGAGKSTLLKILSHITEPTSGEVVLRGRVASLLEVGTGFVGDLSGRENVYLNGAILGMSRREIRSKFDEIVAFAEVEQFIDTPVKRYSSGMYVRLAFAVAAHLEPEILIIDEVLAVGDVQFQKKCLGKMGDVSRQGRTILFVSHNMTAVRSLCQRAILLRHGTLVADDAVAPVVAMFMEEATQAGSERTWDRWQDAPGNDVVRIQSLTVYSGSDADHRQLTMQEPVCIELHHWVLREHAMHHLTFHLVNDQGIVVLTFGTPITEGRLGRFCATFTLPANLLNSGLYYLKLLIVENGNRITFDADEFASFMVIDGAARELGSQGREPGIVHIAVPWSVQALLESV